MVDFYWTSSAVWVGLKLRCLFLSPACISSLASSKTMSEFFFGGSSLALRGGSGESSGWLSFCMRSSEDGTAEAAT